MNFFNCYTAPGRARVYHPGGGKKHTIPDQTLSVRDLFTRYRQGRDVPQFDGVYLEEDDILNDFYPERMDVEERLELAAALEHVVTDEYKKRKKTGLRPEASVPEASSSSVGIIRDDIAGV